MRFVSITVHLCALVAGLEAGTLDVSSQASLLLQSGDSLAFLFTDSSYAQIGSAMGIAAYPSQILFNLISAPIGSTGQFTAEVESMDGSVSALFPDPVVWKSGVVQTSGYRGPASVLQDSLTLSNTLSQQIFAGAEAELMLTYTGPDLTVDFPGYSLKDDFKISLAGGPLSVGTLDYDVTLSNNANVTAPEPDSGSMLMTVGLLLCGISWALKRFGRLRAFERH